MTRKRTLRWKRRSGEQSKLLAEYAQLGYRDTGLDWEGRLVLTKPHKGHRDIAIVIERDGTTRVRSIDSNAHPHTATMGR